MKTTVYLSRKLLNQLKVKETESKDLILTVKNVADQKYIVVGYDTSSFPHNYYAVPWPQGYMGEENMYLVGFDDIAKVLCRGGINEESRVFLQALDDVLNGR